MSDETIESVRRERDAAILERDAALNGGKFAQVLNAHREEAERYAELRFDLTRSTYEAKISQLTAERDAALAEGKRLEECLRRANLGFENYERRFYLASDERDGARKDWEAALARISQLEKERDAGHEMAVDHRHRITELERELEKERDAADLCAVLQTSCKNCAAMIDRMHGLEERAAKLRAERDAAIENEGEPCFCPECMGNVSAVREAVP